MSPAGGSADGPADGLVCRAIRRRLLLQGTYHGAVRVFEPHAHGTTRDEREVVLGYQREGGSNSGVALGWRLFDVAGFADLELTTVRFLAPRDDFRPDHHSVSSLHCALTTA